MDPTEARTRFAAARVARLATVGADGRPHLVPVVFAVDGPRVYSAVDDVKPKATMRLKRLRNLAENPAVALLADTTTTTGPRCGGRGGTGSLGSSTRATPRRRTPAGCLPGATRSTATRRRRGR